MNTFRLITVMVPHGKCDMISEAAAKAGSWGGTVLNSRGISANKFLDILGFGETSLEMVLILSESENCQAIINSIVEATSSEKKNFGMIYTSNAGQLLKAGKITGDKPVMNPNNKHQLITLIVNRGYADDAMAAARKAGAGGGTVLNARGTAREDDEKFFGVNIVPEKEMLLIICSEDKKIEIIEELKKLPCLSQPGSGIAFCSEIEDFAILGKK